MDRRGLEMRAMTDVAEIQEILEIVKIILLLTFPPISRAKLYHQTQTPGKGSKTSSKLKILKFLLQTTEILVNLRC